jgi:uncharacterized protein YndB with AHSA1/START domain
MTIAVRKTVQVNAPAARAFAVFTDRMGTWWPLVTHHIGAQPAVTVVIEPRVGGRWFEQAADRSECSWGRVLVWEPPNRVVLGWEISARWVHDPSMQTEVDVRFIAEGPHHTRVELEHRLLERYGDRADDMRQGFDSKDGWTSLLDLYVAAAATSPER